MHRRINVLKPVPSGVSASQASRFGMPSQLLDQARSRLAVLGGLFTVLLGMSFFVSLGLVLSEPEQAFVASLILDSTAFSLSVAVFWVARSTRASHSQALMFGLVWLVASCGLQSLQSYWITYELTGHIQHLTWASVIIVMYPLLVPTPPRFTLISSILAAATVPASALVCELFGVFELESLDYLMITISPLFSAVVAVLGAQMVYGLGVHAAEARQLGSYLLEEKLGAGGMGEVWRGRHQMLARPAAVKLIRTGDDLSPPSATRIERFEREAQVTAGLNSPHTVALYDFGVGDDGVIYYVMELLEGIDLESLVEHYGPQPEERVIHLLRQACHSLDEAHEQALVHRDVKPANLVASPRYGGDDDFLKVLDFGLVALKAERQAQSAKLTVEGSTTGTPAYMPPEVATGAGEVDHRADIYALGCVAYWLLTGQTVFSGETPMKLVVAHIRDLPDAPSTVSELPISAEMDALVVACLAKDAAERPQTARELSRQLGALPLAAAWTPERAREWWKIHGL